jgi:hypothetical protein
MKIDADDLLEGFRGQIPPETRRQIDAGAVDENVDAPEAFENALSRHAHGSLVGDIEWQSFSAATRGDDVADGGFKRRGAPAAQHHAGARLREFLCASKADAAARAGEPCHFALEHSCLLAADDRATMPET